jgi:hypothetical protein
MKLRFSAEQLETLLDFPEHINISGVEIRGEDILIEVTGTDQPDDLEAAAVYSRDEEGHIAFEGYESATEECS